MDSSETNADLNSLVDISPYSIDLPNESSTSSQLNEEFQSLIKRINKILQRTKIDIDDNEYVYKEHYNELRRQVQLAKETQIQKIEEISDNLLNEIEKFEKESLDSLSKVNKEQLVNKLNQMKQENEKWNQRLEFKVDNQMLNQLRDSLSKIAVERDNFNCLLHNKMMKFKDYNNQEFVGELSQVSLDSIEEMSFRKHLEELEKRYLLKDEDDDIIAMSFKFKEGKILYNGDLLLCGLIKDEKYDSHDVVLILFDLNNDLKLKKIKQLCVDYDKMVTSSDKICLSYRIKNKREKYRAREETEDDKEYQEAIDKAGDYVILILNENLEKLHRFKSHEMLLIGANDLFLFFDFDSNHKDGIVSFYTWSMEYVKTIGQSNDPNLPFYFERDITKFANMFGRYYFIDLWETLKIVDEETGIHLKAIKEAYDFCFDINYNIIFDSIDSIQCLSHNGDFLREIKIENYYHNLIHNDKRCFIYDANVDRLCFRNKYNEITHEVT